MSIPLLKTKLYVPPVRPELVSRPRLVERLNAGLDRKLTLLSAPAGFGKTTLLSEWLRSDGAASSLAGCAWISLDEGDNDPVRFLAYLVAAIQTIEPLAKTGGPSGGRAVDNLQSPRFGDTGILVHEDEPAVSSPGWGEAILTNLVNEIATLSQGEGQPIVLVLDDYHAITAQRVHDAVTFLLDHLPGQMHLVIATRADPPLPIPRLRARGQLTELRQDDLCFTLAEAAAFLNDALGQGLTAEDVTALETHTEGWIAGLQMAAVAMQSRQQARLPQSRQQGKAPQAHLPHKLASVPAGVQRPGLRSMVDGDDSLAGEDADLSGFVSAFTGSHRFILDYLVEEVLGQQPPAIQDFLLRTSILGRMTGALCDAVLEKGDSSLETEPGQNRAPTPDSQPPLARAMLASPQSPGQQALERLEKANLFIIPLDDERRWYRYHRLFADLLRQRLLEAQPDLVSSLHRRASRWYERNGLTAEAIEHALAAGDFERMADLVEGAAEAILMQGEAATFRSWLEQLPAEQVRTRPNLCIYQAWTRLLRGRSLDEVEAHLQRAADAEEAIGETFVVRSQLAVLQAMTEILKGRTTRAAELSRRALDGLPKDEGFWHIAATWVLSVAQLADGDLTAGRQVLFELAQRAQEKGNFLIAVAALRHLARMRLKEGRLYEAQAIFERALTLASDGQGRALPIAGDVLLGLGELWREWNDLETATCYLLKGIDLARQWRDIGALNGYASLIRAKQAQGDLEGAQDAIRQLQQLAAASDATDLDDLIVSLLQARFWIHQGNVDAAARWAEKRGLGTDSRGPRPQQAAASARSHLLKHEQIVLARLFIAQGRPDEALTVLEPLLPRMEEQRRVDLLIEVQILVALALQAQADIRGALAAVEHALSLARPGGYVRVFADEGQPMARLLRQATTRGLAPDYVAKLLATLEKEAQDRGQGPPGAGAGSPAGLPPLVEPLSARELEVLRLLTSSLSTPEIAQELVIATSTVRSHVKSIYGKLGVHRRWDAVERAKELGLL